MANGGENSGAPGRDAQTSAAAARRRLFLALRPGEALRAQLEHRLRKAVPRGVGRLVPGANLHITLVFLGDVGEDIARCVERAAGEVSGEPFELPLDHIGHWRRPRILWLGPTHTPAALFALVGALRERVAACGIAPEARPYQAHMTLARKVQRRPQVSIEPLVWAVDSFALMESVPAPKGVVYRELAAWPLGVRSEA